MKINPHTLSVFQWAYIILKWDFDFEIEKVFCFTLNFKNFLPTVESQMRFYELEASNRLEYLYSYN
jgi:hypothetical protein